MFLDVEEAQRISALIVVSALIVGINAARVYWPKDQVEIVSSVTPPRELQEAERFLLGEAMDLNRASAAELELLSGVGPKLAARLIAARPFHSFEEVDRVRGVGARLIEGLRKEATIRGPISPPARRDSRAR